MGKKIQTHGFKITLKFYWKLSPYLSEPIVILSGSVPDKEKGLLSPNKKHIAEHYRNKLVPIRYI